MSLKGKTAIVTGGSRGIGRAIALRLAKDGANVGVLNLQEDLGLKVADEIREFGVEAIPLVCDVTDYNKVKASVGKIHQEWGSIDILINNAGIDESRYFVETDEGLWEKMINVNVVMNNLTGMGQRTMKTNLGVKQAIHRQTPGLQIDTQVAGQK